MERYHPIAKIFKLVSGNYPGSKREMILKIIFLTLLCIPVLYVFIILFGKLFNEFKNGSKV